MDISKEYIKMCEKAEEIQKQMPDVGDSSSQFFVCKVCGQFYSEDEGFNWCRLHIDDDLIPIWLPRQDQLQEIVKFSDFIEKNKAFYRFVFGYKRTYTNDFTSMEQLWLAFVMSEKYQKTWNREEWKNER